MADYFAADEPAVISSRYPRWTMIKKNKRDPTTAFGNNRGVPVPEWYDEDILEVGGLRLDMDKIDAHETGDYLIYLDKERVKNANEGINMRSSFVFRVFFSRHTDRNNRNCFCILYTRYDFSKNQQIFIMIVD